MLQALTHCTTVLWLSLHPLPLTPSVSVWQGGMSRRMRGRRTSPGCCALANPDFMQCDTEEDTSSCAPFRAELSEPRPLAEPKKCLNNFHAAQAVWKKLSLHIQTKQKYDIFLLGLVLHDAVIKVNLWLLCPLRP